MASSIHTQTDEALNLEPLNFWSRNNSNCNKKDPKISVFNVFIIQSKLQ